MHFINVNLKQGRLQLDRALYNHGQKNHTHLTNPILSVSAGYTNSLAVPTGFSAIWNDSGSGANTDVTFWRMICSDGRGMRFMFWILIIFTAAWFEQE